MQRRGFLGAILAAGMAPAFVGAKVLMPVKQIIVPPEFEYVEVTGQEIVECANESWNISEIVAEAIRRRTPDLIRSLDRNNVFLEYIKHGNGSQGRGGLPQNASTRDAPLQAQLAGEHGLARQDDAIRVAVPRIHRV